MPTSQLLTELISLPVEAHRVRLEAATPRILRLSVAAARELEDAPSYAVEPRRWKSVQVTPSRGKAGGTSFSTGELTVAVATAPFSLTVTDRQGHVRFATAPARAGGRYTDRKSGNPPFEWSDEGVLFSRRMFAGEAVYGFGELGETLNRSGYRFSLWNTDDIHHTPRQNFYCQMPFSIHAHSAATAPPAPARKGARSPRGKAAAAPLPPRPLYSAVFVDNPGRVEVDLGRMEPEVARWRVRTGDFVVWLIFADSLPELLQAWTGLVGRMERPPLWALGYHQCRYSYYPEKQVRRIAAEFRRRRIPCDVLYFDIHYMDGFRVFTWDKRRFPDPAGLMSDLASDGFRTVAIVDPGVKVDPEDDVFQSFRNKTGFFCERTAEDEEHEEQETDEQRRRVKKGQAPLLTDELIETHEVPPMRGPQTTDRYFTGIVWPGSVHFPDFTRPEVRKLWGEWQQRRLLDAGVAGIWNDMNEPAVFDTSHHTFPDDVLHYDHGRLSPHPRVHQVYGMCMAQASFEGIRRSRKQERPFVITRSGWAGVQRYAMLWTGDNHSTWASMALDIQLNLSMGLSGVSMVGCDIGGFIHDSLPELYARWIEWGVFQPFCRTHTAIDTAAQEPWSFGSEVENIAREMIGLRMRLLPYLYTLLVEASETGTPVNRPLFWHYPDDPHTCNLSDQFLLGRDLLIAPVLSPSVTNRLVYLPEGEWQHFLTGEYYHGGRHHVVEAPLGRPAVFVRAGAVLPMHNVVRQHTGEPEPEITVLEVYPAARMEGSLVEDDGITRGYLKGEQSRVEFRGTCEASHLRLEIGKPSGRYKPARRQWLLRLHTGARTVTDVQVNGRPVEPRKVDGVLELSLRDDRKGAVVQVRF